MRRLYRRPLALILVACAVPRLAVLLHERGAILSSFTEKSDDFARTFVATGTFGLVPGEPSAYTQPLYGFFLIPIYWIFGRSWLSVGLAQIAVAALTAWLVYEIGRRFVSQRAGLVAALAATLNPYLVWHDVHVNREILDQLLAAALVLVTLLAAERRSLRLAALAGAICGLAILGNTRLLFLPVLVAAFLAWRLGDARRVAAGAALLIAASALVLAPWVVRNRVQVGCFAVTTDARALWKANNVNTYATLAAGKWIDDVPPLRGAPPTPEMAGAEWRENHRLLHVDECAQMRLYEHRVLDYWRDHPGGKARLAAQAAGMLWDPRLTRVDRGGPGGLLGAARTWSEPIYVSVLYLLALAGLVLLPRRVAALAVALLAYQTLAAAAFAGATRYRAPWDFLLALLAGGAVAALLRAVQERPVEQLDPVGAAVDGKALERPLPARRPHLRRAR